MNTSTEQATRDPLKLADLPLLTPERDGWPAIRQALEAGSTGQRPRTRWLGGVVAAAASVMLVLGLVWMSGERPVAGDSPGLAASDPAVSPGPATEPLVLTETGTLPELIGMSQLLESRVRQLRDNTSGIPARAAMYTAELEDMIARVDGEISMDPESLNLWAQRVNLLLDLQYIYQHQFDREYGRMAAL